MGSFSIWHWVIVLVVVLILFGGGGKLSRLMGDMARGVNAFKKGLKDDGESGDKPDQPTAALKSETSEAVADSSKKDEAAKG